MTDVPRTPEQGLSAAQAAARLQAEGPNELHPPQRRTAWHIALEAAREPMFQLLLAAGLLYLLLGDRGEAFMLLAFVALTVAITIVQEQRTESALESLRDLTSPRAQVLRDGQRLRIAGREVVRGDLLVLTEGDRVAADAWLLAANDLQADESLLTGEALPAAKSAAAGPYVPARPGEGKGCVYAGTLLVSGQGLAQVVATGSASEIGRIGADLAAIEAPPTPLHLQTRRLVRVFAVLGLVLSVAVVVLFGLLRGNWLAGLLAGITLAMSMLPQEFVLILTVFMAMGAWRLSRQNVLARRAATIETLGSATVLCTDKTGTLTQNRMAIVELAAAHGRWTADQGAVPAVLWPLLESGLLASERDPFDAMDRAFVSLAAKTLPPAQRHDDWQLVHEYGLAPEQLAMTHVWQAPGAATCVVAAKGAPEAVGRLCRLDPDTEKEATAAAQAMAARGLRVLAVASASAAPAGDGASWPETPAVFAFEWLGLVGLADPLRPGAAAAVAECRSAGIRVVMITGDHPATADAIAREAGIATNEPSLTGPGLAAMDEAELGRRAAVATVFARVQPEQKLRIVQALQAQGQVVAMTGDGVNDAPSLKAAHIGIAMGQRGTDVAREAASLVLLDDDFGSIVHAVRLGRRIYDNLCKAMAFVLAVHVPIAGLSLLPLLLGLPLVFTPVHIAFLELLIDPVCSIVFEAEAEESDIMSRPPRDPAAPLFSTALILSSLLQGALVLVVAAGVFVGLLHSGWPEAQARAATFTTLVCCNVALILCNRSWSASVLAMLARPNANLWRVLAATAALLAAALLIAPLRRLFHFGQLTPALLGLALGLGLATVVVLEATRRWRAPAVPSIVAG